MPRALSVLLALLSLGLLVLFVHLAWIGFISDSEIWSITLAKHIFEEGRSPWVFTRPLFYGPLALFEYFPRDAMGVFRAAGLAFLVNGLLVAFLGFRLARTLAEERWPTARILPWLTLVFLLSHPFFLEHGARLQPDLVACGLVLFAIERTLRLGPPGERLPWKSVLTWLLPLLATPKAVLSILPFAIFPAKGKPRELAITVALAFLFSLMVFFPAGTRYVMDLALSPPDGQKFFSAPHFRSVFYFFGSALPFTALFALRFVTFTLRWRENLFADHAHAWREKKFAAFTALSLWMMLLSPEKFPYFVASFVPLFAVFTARVGEDLWILLSSEGEESVRRRAPAAVFSLCFTVLAMGVAGVGNYQRMAEQGNATEQFKAVQILENYLNQYPDAIYFDVIGIVPTRARMRLFAGPNDALVNAHTGGWVVSHPPHLIFAVERYAYVADWLAPLIQERYFSLGSGIFARWDSLEKPWTAATLTTPQLHGTIAALAKSVGRQDVLNFSALVGLPGQAPYRVETSLQGVPMLMRARKGLRVYALSPFVDLPILPQPLSKLFRFGRAF